MNTAIERLRAVLPHLRQAAEMAQDGVPGGVVKLAVAAYRADGSGKLGATFEWESFVADIEELCGMRAARSAAGAGAATTEAGEEG